ncbi:ribosome maturation protein RimP [Sphingomonas aracearum]|uniref:Ribosome maturation factor RimP n=1 Tax=Sphingomonas aracearum TaxID=2283317 RepID=A0A369VTP9_9SPHN|nr:ribosome maturation protein RimP [Sphingomonas aracearum]RDE05786.1 ribosome maturation protein RimP [Sphingomonas aracearum]
MADIAALTALIEPEAEALGFELVRVRLFGRGDERTLQIMAERPATGQLNIDDCAELSRRVSDRLDELEAAGRDPIEDAYRLEVSSPGIDRPLTRPKDFADWAGHEARIVLGEAIDGQKQFKGELTGIDGDAITIVSRTGEAAVVPFSGILDAKLVLTDKLIAATVPLETKGADEILELSGDPDEETDPEDPVTEETH